MFTGLIKEIGTVKKISRTASNSFTTVINSRLVKELSLGGSISINGACHTVISLTSDSFTVESSPETINKTNLRFLKSGDFVNLETPLTINQFLDGHIVQGHVDGTGKISSIKTLENSLFFFFTVSSNIIKYLVPKGSVAIDGVSLTVVGCFSDSFSVSVIPHTAKNTTLGKKHISDVVNIEVDILAKYINKYIAPFQNI